MDKANYSRETAHEFIGQEFGVSDWYTLDQERINLFADATGDHQWIHIDPERAANSPFGGTIAHGYLTLSILAGALQEMGICPPGETVMNYGLNKVRFINPVLSGDKIRVRTKIIAVEPSAKGLLITTENGVEIAGKEKPALIAEMLALIV